MGGATTGAMVMVGPPRKINVPRCRSSQQPVALSAQSAPLVNVSIQLIQSAPLVNPALYMSLFPCSGLDLGFGLVLFG